jgi:hypothetical protein
MAEIAISESNSTRTFLEQLMEQKIDFKAFDMLKSSALYEKLNTCMGGLKFIHNSESTSGVLHLIFFHTPEGKAFKKKCNEAKPGFCFYIARFIHVI